MKGIFFVWSQNVDLFELLRVYENYIRLQKSCVIYFNKYRANFRIEFNELKKTVK